MRVRLRVALLTSVAVFGMTATGLSAPNAFGEVFKHGDAAQSLIGSYLAANLAKSANDAKSAALFYRSALATDPENEVLLEQSFQVEVLEANWQRAVPLARQLIAANEGKTQRMAHLLLGLDAFNSQSYSKAEKNFETASEGPIGELTSTLARAWTEVARGNTKKALKLLNLPKQAEWAQFYLNYHKALIADVAGRQKEAAAAFERTYEEDNRTLRTALAYARHAAHYGHIKRAKSILRQQIDQAQREPHPLARDLLDKIEAGEKISLLIKTPEDGLTEVFYGLGEALTSEGGLSMGILYLQMALYLQPDHAFALAALANAYEASRRYDDAIAAYDRIPPGTALQDSIDIRKAFDLNSLDKVDEAQVILDKLAATNPTDIRPLDALGNIMRSRKRFDEAVDYYSRAIDLLPDRLEKRHWSFYYSRGTCYERTKNWPLAEVDLQKALKLFPDQPLTLNYLGYSWVDQNRNLKQGMALIEKAVALKPDDGYIVDSLGWAHYKLGNFKQSVRFLERAVELRPEDPVLNDHLGDALWRVGREREARYQWDQSLTLDPEPENAAKIKKKLADGLPPEVQAQIPTRSDKTGANKRQKQRKESKLTPPSPVVE
ncbi:MAG: tetratricopeptide repeat protein [Hyphomicrobium sp.]